jgi:hypothetical protein
MSLMFWIQTKGEFEPTLMLAELPGLGIMKCYKLHGGKDVVMDNLPEMVAANVETLLSGEADSQAILLEEMWVHEQSKKKMTKKRTHLQAKRQRS